MSRDVFNSLQSKGGGKGQKVKDLLDQWNVVHDEKVSFAKYNPQKYYWMEPNEMVLKGDWTPVLFNMDTMIMTVFRVPKDSFFVGEGGLQKKRKDPKKQNSLSLKFREESFTEICSKMEFGGFVSSIIKVSLID